MYMTVFQLMYYLLFHSLKKYIKKYHSFLFYVIMLFFFLFSFFVFKKLLLLIFFPPISSYTIPVPMEYLWSVPLEFPFPFHTFYFFSPPTTVAPFPLLPYYITLVIF